MLSRSRTKRLDLAQLVEDLLALQRGQAAQRHIQDGARLDRGQAEARR